MPRSIIPAFLRSPAELRTRLAAVDAERARLASDVAQLEEKVAQYSRMFLNARAEVVGLKAILDARGIKIPQPRRKVLAMPRSSIA